MSSQREGGKGDSFTVSKTIGLVANVMVSKVILSPNYETLRSTRLFSSLWIFHDRTVTVLLPSPYAT